MDFGEVVRLLEGWPGEMEVPRPFAERSFSLFRVPRAVFESFQSLLGVEKR